jgi:hypothetical protein
VREQEHVREVTRLRDECDSLRKRLDEMRELAMESISGSRQAKVSGHPPSAVGRSTLIAVSVHTILTIYLCVCLFFAAKS